jgi:hypothetical protein
MSNHEIEVTTGGNMEILLYPGLNSCVAIRNCTSKSLGLRVTPENVIPVKIQGVNNNVVGECELASSLLTFKQDDNSYVAKWRGNSYGVFFQTVNNADENDGWWEAIRFSMSQDIKDYRFCFNQAIGTDSQALHFWPAFPEVGGSIVNQVSYSQGVIREISKVLFQLNHENGDREFVDMNQRMLVNAPGPVTKPGVPLDALQIYKDPLRRDYIGMEMFSDPILSSARMKDEPIAQFFDQGFDCILIRIHGADNSSGRSPTRVTCTCAMNLELVYDEKALNSRFHMPGVYHPGHDTIQQSIKAAEPNFMILENILPVRRYTLG